MVLMATLTHRSTDCLGGRLHRDAFRRCPSRGIGAARAAGTPDNKQARPAQGRQQRGLKPRHATAAVQPQKHAMGNVVILKRGEQVAPKSETTVTPAAVTPVAQTGNAESVPASTCQLGAQPLSETASAADQCGEPSEKMEAAASDDRCPAPTEKAEKASATKIAAETVQAEKASPTKIKAETVKAEKASPTKTEAETVTSADRCSSRAQARKTEAVLAADLCTAPVKKTEVVAAAKRIGPKARNAEAAPFLYSGASYMVSPDPDELPIPVAFLKPRGGCTAACA